MKTPSYLSSLGKGAVCCACCPGQNSLYEMRGVSKCPATRVFQAMALTITICLGSLPRKCTPAVKANTVDYLLLLIPFTEVSHLQDQAIPPHTIAPDNPTVLLPCTGQCLQGAQALNSPEQCFLQPSAISHQLQFPSTTTATARTTP